jgi:hypothetical protein
MISSIGISASISAAPKDNIAIYTAAAGAIYGAGDAMLHGSDIFKGTWDGLMAGSMAPGAVVGAGIGAGLGTIVNVVMLKPVTEKTWVGWGSAGAAIGGVMSANSVASNLERKLKMPVPVLSASLLGYYGFAVVDAYQFSRNAVAQYPGDAARHQTVSRKLRDKYDPGLALTAGAVKEADDYFFSRGTAEFRDLKNNWEGTFRGTKTF